MSSVDTLVLPQASGVYVVQMLNEIPISVNADRPDIAERCIRVGRGNVKFGRAKNLHRRRQDYVRTFGEGNFRFVYWIETPEYHRLEARVAERFTEHRIAGITGRRNEWLEGVSVETVIAALKEEESNMAHIDHSAQATSSMKVSPLMTTKTQFHAVSTSAATVVESATYLRQHGMDQRLLARMHHPQQRPETFEGTIRYFGLRSKVRGRNISYAARLAFVANKHRMFAQSGQRPFEELVAEALQTFPID